MYRDHGASLKGCRILILEDEYFLADDLERALKERGATVIGPIPAFSEAKAHVANHDLDAVVMEVRLRGEATYSIADDLARRHIPFVFATGYSADTIPKRFQCVPRWTKPYYVEEVVDHLTRYCRRKKPTATYKHAMAA